LIGGLESALLFMIKIWLLVFFQFCDGYDVVDGDKVEVDAANSLSRGETRTSRKRQMQGRTLSPISDEHDETSADEPEPRRSKR